MHEPIALKPLASALRNLLQKHEREVQARGRLESARACSAAVREVVVPSAEQALNTAGIALDAALLEFVDLIDDHIREAVDMPRHARVIEENLPQLHRREA